MALAIEPAMVAAVSEEDFVAVAANHTNDLAMMPPFWHGLPTVPC